MHKQKNHGCLSTFLVLFLIFGLLGSCGQTIEDHSDPGSQSAQSISVPAESEPPVSEVFPEPSELPGSGLTVRFLDVGQADAILISCDGEHMLIDGGNQEDSSLLYSVLRRENIRHLKYVIGTHAHEDHIGGIPGALRAATADIILCPVTEYNSDAFDNFKTAAEASGGITVPHTGDFYDLGSAGFTIVGVNSNPVSPNNTSIILWLSYGETSFLFTGDAERETEQVLLDSGYTLHADVLKVGHHGSDTSTGYPFLREVMPTYAVISCGKNNAYGHPDDGVLSKLRDAGVQTFRTDLQGDIVCKSDGSALTWEVARNADIQTLPTTAPAPTPTPEPTAEPMATASPAPTQEPEPTHSGPLYIGNINSKKVHQSHCSNLPKEKNRVYFDDLDDALAQGYVRCKRCF